MKMTAAVLEKCGQPLKLLELEIPKLKQGQVLVKISHSAICRSQVMEIKGLRGRDKWLPHLLGHEGSGVVIDVGTGVTKVRPRDEVILSWIKSSGLEAEPPEYSHNGRAINAGPITTFNNYSIVSENRVVLKPAGLKMDSAALFGCALATGSGMVLNELTFKKSDKVLVLGLGGIGMSALLALRASGINDAVAADKDEAKCALARSLGFLTIRLSPSDRSVIHTQIAPNGFDYCIEAGGSVESIELGFASINASSGVLLFASHPPHGQHISLDPHELISGKQIRGSWGGATNPDTDLPKLAKLYRRSAVNLSKLTENKFPLANINEAVEEFTKGNLFRPILVMDHPGR